MGIPVEFAAPDFAQVHETYQTLRAFEFAVALEPVITRHRDRIKPEFVANIERGMALGYDRLAQVMRQRGEIRDRVLRFFDDYDLLLCPTAIVPPFPAEQRYVEGLGGKSFATYIDWLSLAYAITLTSLPALSVPCGRNAAGLPVGLQLVGPPRSEAALLGYGLLLEESLGLDLRPVDPQGSR